MAGQPVAEQDRELLLPPGRGWCRRTDPSGDRPLVEHEMSADESATGVEQAAQNFARGRERRVGDDVERPAGEP